MTDLSQQKMQDLVEQLYTGTVEKAIVWKASFNDQAVETTLGRFTIRVSEEFNRDLDDTYCQLILKNNIGSIVDTITPGSLSNAAPKIQGFMQYWQLMDGLYRLAHRQASGASRHSRHEHLGIVQAHVRIVHRPVFGEDRILPSCFLEG